MEVNFLRVGSWEKQLNQPQADFQLPAQEWKSPVARGWQCQLLGGRIFFWGLVPQRSLETYFGVGKESHWPDRNSLCLWSKGPLATVAPLNVLMEKPTARASAARLLTECFSATTDDLMTSSNYLLHSYIKTTFKDNFVFVFAKSKQVDYGNFA